MSNRRYDRDNFQQLADTDLAALSPIECAQASEQLDQDVRQYRMMTSRMQLVVVLQEIDASFVRARRAITDRILPAVEGYGEASHEVWQSVKFWKAFAELSAGVRLNADSMEEAEESVSTPQQPQAGPSRTAQRDQEMDVTLRLDQTSIREPSEVERLHAEVLRDLASPPKPKQPPPSRKPAVFDVDADIPQPELETLSLGDIPGTIRPKSETLGKGKGRAFEDSPASERPRRRMSDMLAATSTPAASRRLIPSEASGTGWDGLADLAKTPLSSFRPISSYAVPPSRQPPARSLLDDSIPDAEPPSLLQQSMRRPPQPSRTPAKEAISRLADDLLRSSPRQTKAFDVYNDDSPEPPSVLKNWRYDDPPLEQPSPSARTRMTELHMDDGDDSADVSIASTANADALAEFYAAQPDDSADQDEGGDGSFTVFGTRRPSTAGDIFQLQGELHDTLHGGPLLASEPFQGSPLAGRDAKHGL